MAADGDSPVRDICRLGLGMALGRVYREVGVALLSLYACEEDEAGVSVGYSSNEVMEAADIRLAKAWLSLSSPGAHD